MAKSEATPIFGDRPTFESNGKGSPTHLGASDREAADTTGGRPLANDDTFAEQLVAVDSLLTLNPNVAPDVPIDLPADVKQRLAPAIDCLQLLAQFRESKATVNVAKIASSRRFPQSFGRFELRQEIGRGGFGVVFLAFDPRLSREVAIKLPRPDCLFTPELRQRFLFEGQAAAGLDHPNIISVHEAGEVDNVCYLASAYCPGLTLAEWIRNRTSPVPIVDAVKLIIDLADAIDHAHSKGVLHRDLKPANVLLAGVQNSDSIPHNPKVTDFGLARVPESAGHHTQTGMVLGTPAYMAPEQALGDTRQIGTHTDVYALGAILYELLTLRKPFESENRIELLRTIATTDAASLRQLRPAIPRDLDAICLKCIEKTPNRRYSTAHDVAVELRHFLAGEPIVARPPSGLDRLVKWTRRRPAAAGFGIASLAGLLVLATAASWHYYRMRANSIELESALSDAKEQRTIADTHAAESRRLAYAGQVRLASELGQSGQASSMAMILDRLRPEPGETDLREFTWRLLWRQAQNEMMLRGHRKPVVDVVWSSDGTTIASTSEDKTLRIIDAATGRLRRVVDYFGGRRPVWSAITPNGGLMAIDLAHDDRSDSVGILDTETGELIARLDEPLITSDRLAISPDGQTVAIPRKISRNQERGAVVLWNFRTNEKRCFMDEPNFAGVVTFSPDGRLFAVSCRADYNAGPMSVHVLSVATGERVAKFAEHDGLIHAVAFSPDSKVVVSGGKEGAVRVWDIDRQSEIKRIDFPGEPILGASFANKGRWIVILSEPAMRKSRVRVLDISTGANVMEPMNLDLGVRSFAVCERENRFALACSDDTVRIYRIQPQPSMVRLPGHKKETWAVAFTPDSKSLISASDDYRAIVWDLEKGVQRFTLSKHITLVSCLAMAPDGRRVFTGSYDYTVKAWDLTNGNLLNTFKRHKQAIRSVAISPNGELLATGGRDRKLLLWNATTGELLQEFLEHTAEIQAITFSPDGKQLISGGSDQQIIVRAVASRSEVARFECSDRVWSIVPLSDGRTLLVGGTSGVLKLLDTATGQQRESIGGHSGLIYCVAISPDGRTFASAGKDRTIRLWQAGTLTELCCLKDLPSDARSIAFSPDGKMLAAGLDDGGVIYWPAADLD